MSLMDIQPQLPIFREIASFYHLKIVKNADFDSLITIWTYKFQIKLCLDGKYQLYRLLWNMVTKCVRSNIPPPFLTSNRPVTLKFGITVITAAHPGVYKLQVFAK